MAEPSPENDFPLDTPVSADWRSALTGLRNQPMLLSKKWQEQQWRANRAGAHPDLLRFEKLFVKRMKALNVPMFSSEVIRTKERQADLYALGNSKAKAGQSPHQYGLAVDLVHSVRGWDMDKRQWALLGHVGMELAAKIGVKLEWGGTWKFYDPAHWQIKDWQTLKGEFPWNPQSK